ncbi:hypothetical protein HanXRQr2_Chr12g0545101 [Helianthus annuus]|uniref:Uncharacterized protein n=1 Tax=Helianthus annuus TaxID=4232 RepID=A0A9K3HH25_HELAN|nr:hypothetical protein HanXRQr2_Chr12g0545101 [Helianthus annuus]KAJ0862995.1 hypothetical protein HanPSC8_Chr12g0524761 [Helianthus annuus]
MLSRPATDDYLFGRGPPGFFAPRKRIMPNLLRPATGFKYVLKYRMTIKLNEEPNTLKDSSFRITFHRYAIKRRHYIEML